MGMTWGIRVRGVAIALAVVAALALASGANWVNAVDWLSW
jgi:hypothetical protein